MHSPDEVGSKTAFKGALLMTSLESLPVAESTTDAMCDSPISQEPGPDSWIQTSAAQPLQADAEQGPAERMSLAEDARMPSSICLNTIWVWLLNEQEEDRRGVPAASVAGGGLLINTGPADATSSGVQPADAAGAPAAAVEVDVGVRSDFTKLGALVSPQIASQVLQIPCSGRCCMCHVSWTDDQRERALAVEKLIEGAVNSSEELDAGPASPSAGNELADALSEYDASQRQYSEGNKAAGECMVCPAIMHTELLLGHRVYNFVQTQLACRGFDF